jgi:Spy/CpxP family protein refolding chaperone
MKLLKLAAVAAVAITGFSVPAAAQDRDHHHGWHHRGHQVCHWYGHGRHRHRECHWVR